MHRAFVIQLSPECRPGQTFAGRVEHIRTGRATHFTNVEEFLDFVSRSVSLEMEMAELERQEDAGLPES